MGLSPAAPLRKDQKEIPVLYDVGINLNFWLRLSFIAADLANLYYAHPE
jgi:hypothetical protein